MKWIRTECGFIGELMSDNEKPRQYLDYKFNDFYGSYFFETDKVNLTDGSYFGTDTKIKKKGDNLIDMLEDNDIVVSSHGQVSTFEDYKYLASFTTEDLHIDNIIKIITHEQYMPHAQLIKEETK